MGQSLANSPFAQNRPPPSPEAGAPKRPSVPSAIKLVANISKLASLPASLGAVRQELQDDRSTSTSVAGALVRDPPLTARILRVVNSGLYAQRERVSSVDRAVSMLGFKEIEALVNSAALAMFVSSKVGAVDLRRLYIRSLLAAYCSESVAAASPVLRGTVTVRKNPYFSAVLLADIGLFAVASFVPDLAARCAAHGLREGVSYTEAEQVVLGYTHARVGGALLQRWRLGPTEVESARCHHIPSKAEKSVRPAVALVHICDALASALLDNAVPHTAHLQSDLEPEHVNIFRLDALDTLKIPREQMNRVLMTCAAAVEKAKYLASMLSE